ncbi:MAG: 30S ribosomal protein S23 [Microgenomates group bacterium Gr01-1014_5]|nr:MAG: 30S ribosomal protein S23 [Microgenomates group bacterium Gr01-1014_5]
METAYSYKKSAAYQKSKQLTLDVVSFFKGKELRGILKYLVNQLVRAISSEGANLAEGYGRYYSQDYRRFISISRGSAFEVDYWLEIIIELNLFPRKRLDEFSEQNLEIIKLLTTMMKRLEVKKSKT